MTTSLQPCPSCSRHIRISEESCPFCAASVSGLLQAAPARKFSGRMGRAALIAASTLVAVPACGGDDDGGEGTGTGGAMSGSGGDDMGSGGNTMGTGGDDVNVPVYGISPSGGENQGSGGDDAQGTGGDDAATGGETSDSGGGSIGPVYGAPAAGGDVAAPEYGAAPTDK